MRFSDWDQVAPDTVIMKDGVIHKNYVGEAGQAFKAAAAAAANDTVRTRNG